MGSGHIVGVSSLAGRVWTPYRWEVAILWVCHHWLGGCGHRTDGKWPYCGCVITGWEGVDTIQMGSGHIVGVSSLAGRVWTPYRWEVAILWVCHHWLGGCGHCTDGKWLVTVHHMTFFMSLLCLHMPPGMLGRGGGHIVGVSSLSGRVRVPFYSSYAAAKSAFCGLLEAVRIEVRSSLYNPSYLSSAISPLLCMYRV